MLASHGPRRSVLILALAAACGAPLTTPAEDARTVRVEMSDFAFSPPQLVVAAGERVALVFVNTGSQEHEFMAGTGAMSGHGYMHDWLATVDAKTSSAASTDHDGVGVRLAPGATATLRLTVPAQGGQVEFACFIVGHYENAMRGVLVIAGGTTPAAPTGAPTAMPSATAAPEGHDAEGH